jgi:transcriptional regulator GlxA family with amidase domain
MDRRVRKIVEVLQDRWKQPPPVNELARHVGLGTSRLEHLFKEQARLSIRDYVRERRLSAAAELLTNTEERISSIGYTVGFANPSNFNHAFKKHFGVSPRAYRASSDPVSDRLNEESAEMTK